MDWLNHTSGRCRRSLRAAMAGWPGNGGRLPDMANWLEEYEAGLNVAGGHETKTVVVQDMPRGRLSVREHGPADESVPISVPASSKASKSADGI